MYKFYIEILKNSVTSFNYNWNKLADLRQAG